MMQELLRRGSERIISSPYINSSDNLKKSLSLHLCWAENIGDGVARKIFVLDWTPEINHLLLSDIDTELGAETQKLLFDIHPPCLSAGLEILLKFLLDTLISWTKV